MTINKDPVAQALGDIIDELAGQFYEQRGVIQGNVYGLLAGEHVFNLGVPGTGKSNMIGELTRRFIGATYFEALLSRTRPDAAILGPYDLPELRENGNFRRKIAGFLPTVDLAFLDEIGKMSPVLGHDLLSILNERKYHEVNNGRSEIKVPLSTAFTASNEQIADESDDAAALWDRLLVRIEVLPIRDTQNFIRLLESAVRLPNTTPTETTLNWVDLKNAIDNVVPTITLPTNVGNAMVELRKQLREHEIDPSPRRWRKSIRVLQASAFLNGRTIVDEDDLNVLRYVMWDSPEQISSVERLTLSISNPDAEKVLAIMDRCDEISRGITEHEGRAIEARAQFGAQCHTRFKQMIAEISQIEQDAKAAGRSTTRIDEARARISQVQNDMMIKMLDMDPESLPRR